MSAGGTGSCAPAAWCLGLCVALSCTGEPPSAIPAPEQGVGEGAPRPGAANGPAPDRARRARALVARYECNRCHAGTQAPPPGIDRDCVQCHRAIRAGSFPAPKAALARWRGSIHSLLVAPDLRAAARLRRSWVAAFLRRPYDVRPGLAASMPRLAFTERDAVLLAEHLVPEEDPEACAPAGDRDRGRSLYVALRCARCHRFTGVALPSAHAGPVELGLDADALEADAVVLAPDLAHARDRLQPDKLVGWLRDPASLATGSLMPDHGLDEGAAADLAAFLLTAPLSPRPPRAARARLSVLEREVRWDEVSARVFRKVCWHCHATPDYALGDGGPGYGGGFGFPARGLDLSSYEGISSGSLGDDGERHSVLAPLPDGTPRLVAHLLARVEEEAGATPAIRGMPLGFPALSREQIQLVETWIAQGRRR